MKTHTIKGAEILSSDSPTCSPASRRPRSPRALGRQGLSATAWPATRSRSLGRILAVADAFDAMTSDRPYRPGMKPDQAFQEIATKAGLQFDPEVARAFLSLRHDVEKELSLRPNSNADTLLPDVLDVVRVQPDPTPPPDGPAHKPPSRWLTSPTRRRKSLRAKVQKPPSLCPLLPLPLK